jgi:hypothetical protein
MIDVKFRDKWDRYHFFGSSVLTVLFFALFVIILDNGLVASAFFAYLLSLLCGTAFETLTQFTPHYEHPFWNKLPKFFREWFSGSPWDYRDIELNALGALVFFPGLIFIGHLFMKRFARLLNKRDQPPGIECVVCGRKKAENDPRKWFSVTQGKYIFYACPTDYPLSSSMNDKLRNMPKIVKAIQNKLSQN